MTPAPNQIDESSESGEHMEGENEQDRTINDKTKLVYEVQLQIP